MATAELWINRVPKFTWAAWNAPASQTIFVFCPPASISICFGWKNKPFCCCEHFKGTRWPTRYPLEHGTRNGTLFQMYWFLSAFDPIYLWKISGSQMWLLWRHSDKGTHVSKKWTGSCVLTLPVQQGFTWTCVWGMEWNQSRPYLQRLHPRGNCDVEAMLASVMPLGAKKRWRAKVSGRRGTPWNGHDLSLGALEPRVCLLYLGHS